MTAVSDYGSTFTFNSVSIGKCIVVGFPEVIDEGTETTNHSSSGYGESIPSGLKRIGDLTLSVLNESGVYSALRTLQNNKTVAAAIVTNGIDTITGSGWVKSVKPEDADATSPKANGITVVLACTGSWS
jgi:hypothetical protein